jgi:hypothetical protein
VTHCCQLFVCPLPWYMHAYRPLPSCNNTPTVPGCQASCIRGYVICIRCLAMGISIQPSIQHVTICSWEQGSKHNCICTRNKWMWNLQATPLEDYQHRTWPPHWEPTTIKRAPHATGASSLPHQLCRKPVHNTSAKKIYKYPTCPHATSAFRKEDPRPSSVSPTQQAHFRSTSAVCHKRPFSGPTAAGVCPCNDSKE